MSDKLKLTTLVIPDSRKIQQYGGQTIILPVAGEVTISKTGTIDIPDTLADQLIAATVGTFEFQLQNSPEAIKLREKNAEKSAYEETLKTMKLEELVSLANDAQIDKSLLVGASDAKIRKLILDKLTSEPEKHEVKKEVVVKEPKVKKVEVKYVDVDNVSPDETGPIEDKE